MKLYRNAIILVCVLGLLLAAYLVFKDKADTGGDTYSGRETIRIVDVSTLDLVEMTIQNADGTFVFKQELVKENEGQEDEREVRKWLLVSPEGLKYDHSRVNSVAINVSSLIADKVVEEEATDFSQYGLDNPAVTVTIKLTDGTVKAVQVGDLTPTKGGYYVKEKDGTTVYTIGTYAGERIRVTKNDLRDKNLITFTPDNIIKITMERKGTTVFSAVKEEELNWTLTVPIKGNANSTAIYPIQEALTGLSVQDFVEEKPTDLGKYGLANPSYVIEAETAESAIKLLLGKELENGSKFYAKLSDSDEVFTISSSMFGFLDKPIEEIVEVFAYIVNINEVSKVTVEMDGRTDVLEIQTDEEDRDKDVFRFNGTDVSSLRDEKDSQYARKYYQALIGVTLSKVEAQAEPVGKPEITFTYYLKKAPGTMKVEFIPKDDRMYYVVRNGEYTGILVDKKKFDEPEGVRDMYNRLKEAMK